MEDIIIRGGLVADGTGAPGYRADVAVRDGRITAIGDLSGVSAAKILDAGGLMVAPGFIDAHAHSDTGFLRDDSCASKLYQGITTEVTGQCGSSPFPAEKPDPLSMQCTGFADFLARFQAGGYKMAVNQAMLVGHGSLRASVLGYDDRPADGADMECMKDRLRRDLAAGAWGMSLGLEYAPGFFAPRQELAELGRVTAEFGGLVTCHMRNEGLKIREAIEELVWVGRESGAHVHISHLKIDHYRAHGRAEQVWRQVEEARRQGVNVTADMYPYTASCTGLTIRCPRWSQEGGDEAVVRRLQGDRRQEIIEGIRSHYFNGERAETCLFNGDGGLWPGIVGRTLRQVAEEDLHTTDYALAAAEVLVRTRGRAGGIFFVMSQADMEYFLRQDVGIGSDGYALPDRPEALQSSPHPRSYGAIARFFQLAREKGICTAEEAVRRVTGLGADMLGMKDRGRLKPGLAADITVFDPRKIGAAADYLHPVQRATGVAHVLVNGVLSLENGRQTEHRAGKFLRKTHSD